MACIREYMHYPATQGLESASAESDEACPIDEKGWTWEVQMHPCSNPENCSSTEEHWQPYEEPDQESDDYLSNEDDHSSEENDYVSDSDSEIHSDEEDHSFDENDNMSDAESENYSDENYCYNDYDSDDSY